MAVSLDYVRENGGLRQSLALCDGPHREVAEAEYDRDIGVRIGGFELPFDSLGAPVAGCCELDHLDAVSIRELLPDLTAQVVDRLSEKRRRTIEHGGHSNDGLVGLRADACRNDEECEQGEAEKPHRERSIVDEAAFP